ncbi:hypothetical protein EDC31_11417 [Acidomonas methanolica]|uniref:hypothetical protein n=1 Tax=Acidomonas methanolica TaxID=437 RepID=UPI00104FF320|nr:hypothetical protein [Acidomonas methanolica]TCS26375.1 hypothetical protein EDC31_11417 [Acidomonas methanolica]
MFSPSNFSHDDIWNEFPRLTNLGASSLGEDADMCGDTLDEAIQDGPRGRNIEFKQQTIQELHKLLSFTDEEIDRITQTWVLLSIDPTADVEEPPNWGRYPTYRAFWEAVLRAFENDPEVQEHRSA